MAVGTGFAQCFRGVGAYLDRDQIAFLIHLLIFVKGQVLGVAISSAIFQSILDRELNARIKGPGATEVSLQLLFPCPLLNFF